MFDDLGKSVFPGEVFKIFGISVNQSAVSGFLTVVLVCLFALVIRMFFIPRFKFVPGAMQMFLEWIVGAFDKMGAGLHKFNRFIGPFIFGSAAYICFGVLIELLGYRPAIADINAGLALGASLFTIIFVSGIIKKKQKRLLRYANPLNIVTDAALPMAITFRLFGSILSGVIIMNILYTLFDYLFNLIHVPLPFPGLLSPVFVIFHALMQAYIFSQLTVTFVGEAVE